MEREIKLDYNEKIYLTITKDGVDSIHYINVKGIDDMIRLSVMDKDTQKKLGLTVL